MRRKAAVPKEERPVRQQAFAYRESWRDRSSGRWIRSSCAGAFSCSPDCGSCWPDCWRLSDSAPSCCLRLALVLVGGVTAGGLWLLRRYGSPAAPAGRPPVDQVARPAAEGPARTARLAAAPAALRDPRSETGSRCFRSDPGLPGSRADPLEGWASGVPERQRLRPIRPVSSWLAGAGAPPPRSPA